MDLIGRLGSTAYRLASALQQRQTMPFLSKYRQLYVAPRQAVNDYVNSRLGELLLHACETVPYYQKLGMNMRPGIPATEQLKNFPILTRHQLVAQLEQLTTSSPVYLRRSRSNNSGGSTGVPVEVIQGTTYQDAAAGMEWLGYEVAGSPMGSRALLIWGSESDFFKLTTKRQKLIRFLLRQQIVNAFSLGASEMSDIARLLRDFRPDLVIGYASSLFTVAQHLLDKGIRVRPPRSIMSSAEQLLPDQRAVIEAAFGTSVHDRYGCREVGAIAQECQLHSGMHVCTPFNYLEVVDAVGQPAPPGTPGRILVTNLENRALPLIRYEIGDLGILAPDQCKCGCTWPLLQQVTGRISDMFLKNDGTLVSGNFFTHMFRNLPGVVKFQVVQESLAAVTVLIVGNANTVPFDRVREIICAALGAEVSVAVQMVDDIPKANSGKYRFTVSKVWGRTV